MPLAVIRIGLVLAAVLAVAWLVVAIRSVDSLEEGEAAVRQAREGTLPAADAQAAQRALADARRFAVDTQSRLAEASLLVATGRGREADQIVRTVLASEPENDQAWFLALVTAPDAARARVVRQRLEALNPWVEEGLR